VALPIEAYAVIGDCRTAALVGTDGSIDWLGLPRFDSPACFAALLGTNEHGHWQIAPDLPYTVSRRYLGDSFVLETTFTTADGVVQLVDAMPIGDQRSDVVRLVHGVSGSVRMRHEWVARFAYGKVRPWVHRIVDPHGHPALHAVAGPDMLVLRGSRLPTATDHKHVDVFDIGAGEKMHFSVTWFPSWTPVPQVLEAVARVDQTVARWHVWAAVAEHEGAFAEAYVRSLLVLRVLTHSETGGIVAAATTSLPEQVGGGRNWDYRFCWLRDASLTLTALLAAGFTDEAQEWRQWLVRAVAGDPEDLQIMYGVDGSRELPERVLDHLPGYEGSSPVRVGNAAVDQRQTDVLGELMAALHTARASGLEESDDSWALQRTLVDHLADHWREPDNGIWEIRGEPREFTHSRIMVWAAFDRAVRAVEEHGLAGPVEHWRQVRDAVRAEVLDRGWDEARTTFVQYYGATRTDASLLQIVQVGFLPADDPKVVGTVQAIERELLVDGLLLRYRTEQGVDGLPPGEGPFLACSFWLAEAYARCGRIDDAHTLLMRLCGLANDVGLLSEEHDPVANRMLGNFPQALSHLALVGAVLAYREAVERAHLEDHRSEHEQPDHPGPAPH
jgi:GH15 family glucan-1,4-alpha-glucosidase